MKNKQNFTQKWRVKPNAKKILSKYESFEHLYEHIRLGSNGVITMCMYKHLLHGGTLKELVDLALKDNLRLGSNDFLKEKRINDHIKWCCKQERGWIIEENKYGVFRIVGYRGERDSNVDEEHAIQKSYYSSLEPPEENFNSQNKDFNNLIELEKKLPKLKKEVDRNTAHYRKMNSRGEDTEKKKVENRIIEIFFQFLKENRNWLSIAFKMTELISIDRGNHYGFEWPVQTALGCFLLGLQDKGSISSVRIGMQEKNKNKYDISFELSGQRIIIEIKTPGGGAISYVKSDVRKEFPNGSLPFFLVFSDPKAPSNAPKLEGTHIVKAWVTHEDFRCYLYKKKL